MVAGDATRLLAIDPGERAGWATAEITEGQLWTDLDIESGIMPLREMGLWTLEHAYQYDVIVYETWRLRASMAKDFIGSDFPTIQLIGMIRLAAWQAGKKLAPQSPTKKATANKSAAMCPALGRLIENEPARHDEAHNVDAARHLWYYCWNRWVTS